MTNMSSSCARITRTSASNFAREEYLRAEHILVMGEAQPRIVLESTFTRLGISREVVVVMPLYMSALQAAAESNRILTVPARLAMRFARQFGLVIHPMPFSPMPVALSLVSHPIAEHAPSFAGFVASYMKLPRSSPSSVLNFSLLC